MDFLPMELKCHVAKFCDGGTLRTLEKVSRTWWRVLNEGISSVYWKSVIPIQYREPVARFLTARSLKTFAIASMTAVTGSERIQVTIGMIKNFVFDGDSTDTYWNVIGELQYCTSSEKYTPGKRCAFFCTTENKWVILDRFTPGECHGVASGDNVGSSGRWWYRGRFKQLTPHGIGVWWSISDGNNVRHVRSRWENGRPTGYGTIHRNGVLVYEGDMTSRGVTRGIRYYPTRVWVGTVKCFRPWDHGTMILESGETYQGHITGPRSLPNGYGVYTWPNGNEYCGDWVNGQREGNGCMYYKKHNVVHEGEYQNDRRHGYGKLVWYQNKMMFHGKFVNGGRHGMGILTDRSTDVQYVQRAWNEPEHIGYNSLSEIPQWNN